MLKTVQIITWFLISTFLVGCLPGVEKPGSNTTQRSTNNTSPTPGTPTPTPFITSTPLIIATATPTGTVAPTPTIPLPTQTPTAAPTGTVTPTPTLTPTPTATPTPIGTPFPSPTPSPTPTPIVTPSPTPTPTATPSPTPTPTPTGTAPPTYPKTITVQYQRPGFTLSSCSGGLCNAGALNYTGASPFPVRGAVIEAFDNANGLSLESKMLDETGQVSFTIYNGANVYFVVYAEIDGLAGYPKVSVKTNVTGDTGLIGGVWAWQSPVISFTDSTPANFTINTGWSGSNASGSYTGPRSASPFAILDTVYQSMKWYKDNGGMSVTTLPTLNVNWSPSNTPSSGDYSLGQIGTSHYRSDTNELYILGHDGVDTDEFDAHVIAHEWTHFMEANLSRSDSLGGAHGFGDKKDPTLAFGEGFANASSALVHQPDSFYKDSYGSRQQSGFGFDMETRASFQKTNPGWFSEDSVGLIVYDLFDSDTDGVDTTSAPVSSLVSAFTTNQKTDAPLTTIFSLVSYVKAINSGNSTLLTAIDNILSDNSIQSITDPYGTGMTNNGGNANFLPVYQNMTTGLNRTVYLFEDANSNSLARNRYVRFTAASGMSTAKIWVQSNDSFYIQVYSINSGGDTFITGGSYPGGNSLSYLPVSVTPGQEYIVHFFSLSSFTGFKTISNVEVTQE